MALYLDTSVIVALFFREASSFALLARLKEEPEWWVSHWTLAEFFSAVSFKRRSGQADEQVATAAAAKLRASVADGTLWVEEVQRTDFDRAGRLCEAHVSGLRTPDALHAAIAERMRLPLLTCDKRLAAGCRLHAIPCEYLNGVPR